MTPESPREAGLLPAELTTEGVEPAHAFANDVRERLRGVGFSDDAIDDWSREFVAHGGAGETAALLRWIVAEERRHDDALASAAVSPSRGV
ncbi:MAG: hypothetical protein QOE35_2208 [Actinomycetota bacterium]|jgi:hypothetical protein